MDKIHVAFSRSEIAWRVHWPPQVGDVVGEKILHGTAMGPSEQEILPPAQTLTLHHEPHCPR